MENFCGIYTITNKINGKIYVGYTSHTVVRFRVHLSNLRLKRHDNIHLQRAWNNYGEENFIFELLVECHKDNLASEEHYWATLLNVHDRKFGYNLKTTHPYGSAGDSEETRLERSKNVLKRISEGKHYLPDNSADKNGMKKLNWQKVYEIRSRSSEKIVDLMAEFKVSRKSIYNILHNKTWKI